MLEAQQQHQKNTSTPPYMGQHTESNLLNEHKAMGAGQWKDEIPAVVRSQPLNRPVKLRDGETTQRTLKFVVGQIWTEQQKDKTE